MSNVDLLSPSSTLPNILNTLPPEIWEQIFSLACTDGGFTGRSLSLVSKQCYELSQSTKYNSVIIQRARQLILFASMLRAQRARNERDHDKEIGFLSLPQAPEGASLTSSSTVSSLTRAPIPRIRHLFVGLGDLFFDLAESNADEEDDDDYVYDHSGPQGFDHWVQEYPESESSSSSNSSFGGDDEDGSGIDELNDAALDILPGGETAGRERSEGANTGRGEEKDDPEDVDDDDSEAIKIEIQADLEWLHSQEGRLDSSLVSTSSKELSIRAGANSTTSPPHISEEYRIAERQCQEILHELLASDSCGSLQSLYLFVEFKFPVNLKNVIPPLKRLERLAVYSERDLSWGDFVILAPDSIIPTTARTVLDSTATDAVPSYPSLRTLRVFGDWSEMQCFLPTWLGNLSSFLRSHTPKLERIRVPLPGFHTIDHVHTVLDLKYFPPTIHDIVAEIPNFGTLRLQKQASYIKQFRGGPSKRRILLLNVEQYQNLDYWIHEWKNKVANVLGVLDIFPPETWERIFSLACTDGGYTGRSLSLVSRKCHSLSQSARYHSVSIKRARQLVLFAGKLRAPQMQMQDDPEKHEEVNHQSLKVASGVCSVASSSSFRTPIPKVRHLFVGLGDLFYDLAESAMEDEDDEDYVYKYPGIPDYNHWLYEYPSSESESSLNSGSEDEDEPENRVKTEKMKDAASLGEEMALRKGSADATNESSTEQVQLEDVDEETEIRADLLWLHSREGRLGSATRLNVESATTEPSARTSNRLPRIREEYELAEHRCLEILHELLTSPFCVGSLKSLYIFIDLKFPINLKSFVPPLNKLERLAVYSKREISWGDFIALNSSSIAPEPFTEKTFDDKATKNVPLFSSLRTLRIFGNIREARYSRTWLDDLSLFLRNHAPRLERIYAPLPNIYKNEEIGAVLDSKCFPSTTYDIIAEVWSFSAFCTQKQLCCVTERKANPSNRRFLIVNSEDLQVLDNWVEEWKKEVVSSEFGDMVGGHTGPWEGAWMSWGWDWDRGWEIGMGAYRDV
ncbi:hypothetical protein AX16_005864 [Volvariella volvacea WC 439]|nr:hypothetical protein AX16_005864 [Volvariella volvacea WC 439]